MSVLFSGKQVGKRVKNCGIYTQKSLDNSVEGMKLHDWAFSPFHVRTKRGDILLCLLYQNLLGDPPRKD